MAYDPYGPQSPEQQMTGGDMVRDFATYPIKPSSYISMMGINPAAWSGRRGILIPFAKLVKDIKKFKPPSDNLSLTGISYSKKISGVQKTKNLISAYKPFVKRGVVGMFTLGLTEAEFKGGKFTNANLIEQRWRTSAEKNILSIIQKSGSVPKKRAEQLAFKMSKDALSQGKVGTYNFLKDKKNTFNVIGKESIDLQSLRARKRAGWVGRLGLRGMRVASAVGLAMLAWDIGSMVAKPLASAAMNALNNAAVEYQNRFMPELGGQLQLSYLSYGAATERQRSIQAISKAYINGRSALGNEGQLYHQ